MDLKGIKWESGKENDIS